MFVLSSPTWTWEHNVTTGAWNERQSYGLARWLGALTISFQGTWYAADFNGGALYAVDLNARTEAGQALVWGLDSGPIKSFPTRLQVPAAAFDFVLGQAAIDGGNPQVLLSWSHDGGATWANPLTRSLGRIGHSVGRIILNRIGLSSHHGVRYRFRVSDPAYTSFAGGVSQVNART